MPGPAGLFRIIGGGQQSSSSSNNNNNNNNNNNSGNSNSLRVQAQQARSIVSRSLYPGQRSSAVPPNPAASNGSLLPTETPRIGMMMPAQTGLLSSSTHPHSSSAAAASSSSTFPASASASFTTDSTTSSGTTTTTTPSGNVVLRGSHVVQQQRPQSTNLSSGPQLPDPPANMSSSSNNNNNSANRTTTTTTGGPSTTTTIRPGAYQVTRVTTGGPQIYRVTVPQGVRPGAEFSVHAGQRRVRVRCPPTSRPGQSLQITLPPEQETIHKRLGMAPLTAADNQVPGGGAIPMTSEVQKVNQAAEAYGGAAQTFLVTIPPNIFPNMQFTVNVNGQRFMVTCPPNAGPNTQVRIVPPASPAEPEAAPRTQVFEVAVPPGVEPGQPFALVANGQRVLVTCPNNVAPGQKIRFQLPVSQVVGNIQLSYESEKGGWSRTIRVKDLKFQWVRLDGNNPASSNEPTAPEGSSASLEDKSSNLLDTDVKSFDFMKSAYVRKITFLEGNDARMRTGKIELVPASEAVVESRLVVQNRTLLSYADIAAAQGKSLDEKISWFQNVCKQLTPPWEDGHMKLVIRRNQLLLDSIDAVMSMGRDDTRKAWKIEFLGEEAIDAGGVTREWFQLVTEQIFDPEVGLWLSSTNNQMCVNINPASDISCPEDHLVYFRFLGRVLGRALFTNQLVSGHMVRTLYKHLLGWPVTFEDIKMQDEIYYENLKKLTSLRPEDIEMMYLDFTVTEDYLGQRKDFELLPGGIEKSVTAENINEYLEENLKYRLMNRFKPQLTELLLGFFDIVPEPALTVFDANELELILCGLPNIDMDDWVKNTKYSGMFSIEGRSAKTVEWFWEVVSEYDTEMKARLLQFVTGTSGVPSRGFAVLQGVDGDVKKFTVHGVDAEKYSYPRAHTCFNRIDLPNYHTKKELKLKLTQAITMCGVGFDME